MRQLGNVYYMCFLLHRLVKYVNFFAQSHSDLKLPHLMAILHIQSSNGLGSDDVRRKIVDKLTNTNTNTNTKKNTMHRFKRKMTELKNKIQGIIKKETVNLDF